MKQKDRILCLSAMIDLGRIQARCVEKLAAVFIGISHEALRTWILTHSIQCADKANYNRGGHLSLALPHFSFVDRPRRDRDDEAALTRVTVVPEDVADFLLEKRCRA